MTMTERFLGPLEDMTDYRQRDISVIPIEFMGKRPKIDWMEFQQRLATPEEIHEWCRVRCNVALVMGKVSGLIAVDADSDAALQWIKKNLPESPVGTRTAKGEHSFYSLPDGMIVGNRARLKGMKLDVRGEGGYVLASPSVHETGVEYERLGDWEKLRECPVFDPDWLEAPKTNTTRIVETGWTHPDVTKRAHNYAAKVPGAISGQGGHRATIALAIKLARIFGLNEDELFEVMWPWNDKCEPRWSRKEIQHKCIEAVRIVNGPVTEISTQVRSNAMLTVKNPREDRCVICRKTKEGGDAEFIDKRFPGPVFMCWTDMKNSVMPEKPKTEKKS